MLTNTIVQRRESSTTRQSLAMSGNNMSRKSVLGRLNMDMLDGIEIVGEEVTESTDDSTKKDLVMEKRTSTTKSIKVNLER